MAGVEVRHADGSPAAGLALRAVKGMLRRGFMVLPEGADGNVISLTPPLTITRAELAAAVPALKGSSA